MGFRYPNYAHGRVDSLRRACENVDVLLLHIKNLENRVSKLEALLDVSGDKK